MKMSLTNIIIAALVAVVVVVPAALYISDYAKSHKALSMDDYCSANGFEEVFPCIDGSFQSIRANYTEGFRIVKPDDSTLDCPFTLPQYQVGECAEYTTAGMCGGDNLCEKSNSCVRDADCSGKCLNWTCS